jgi:hypothetical protein
MTTAEVQELAEQPNVHIGVHSQLHDVIPTGTHPRKRKPLSQWKLARFNNSSEISGRDLSIRSKIAFQGFNFQDGALKRRSETEWEDYIHYDTEQCLAWMENNLGITPVIYCFPFNEYNEKVLSILKSFGFNQFFAARPGKGDEVRGRVDIDSLVIAT